MLPFAKLEGHYFHSYSLENGKPVMRCQGRIVSYGDGWCLVQLYSWIDGAPTNRVLTTLAEMKDWKLYQHEDDWLEAAKKAN